MRRETEEQEEEEEYKGRVERGRMRMAISKTRSNGKDWRGEERNRRWKMRIDGCVERRKDVSGDK